MPLIRSLDILVSILQVGELLCSHKTPLTLVGLQFACVLGPRVLKNSLSIYEGIAPGAATEDQSISHHIPFS